MIFVLSPAAVRNPDRLRTDRIPKRVLGRGFGFTPRGGPMTRVFWRLVLEQSLTRYVLALAPFPLAMLLWPSLALPISQAPILMFGIVLFIESNVLSIPTPEKRRALVDPAEAARGLDLLRARARDLLVRVAARRGLTTGLLHLVIEQSAMARVAPFTLLSLQFEGERAELLDPDPEEERLLRERLFGDGLDEALLHRINLAENAFLRDIPLDARAVSAHARLAAHAERAERAARA